VQLEIATVNPSEEVTSAPKQARLRPAALWLAVLLFIITALVFLRATKGDFLVYDDTTFVTRNAHVKTGLTRDNVVHAFFGVDEVSWEPLSTLSHILDCQIFGLKPWGHHLVNVLKEAALREFETAVKDHPDSFDAHSDLARALAMAGRRKESIAQLKLALLQRPGDPNATSHLAEMEAAENR
jgi:tetratricopeptide (TPR) repeat protein